MTAATLAVSTERSIADSTTERDLYVGQALGHVAKLRERLAGPTAPAPAPAAIEAPRRKRPRDDLYALYESALLAIEELAAHNYPTPSLLLQGCPTLPSAVQHRTCARCAKTFAPRALDARSDGDALVACSFHPMRLGRPDVPQDDPTAMRLVSERSVTNGRVYLCCYAASGTIGCQNGPHVYEHVTIADAMRHSPLPFERMPFLSPSEIESHS